MAHDDEVRSMVPFEGVRPLALAARTAARSLRLLPGEIKDRALRRMAWALRREAEAIYRINDQDIADARANGMSATLIRRLDLESTGVEAMATVLERVAEQPDPIGRIEGLFRRPDGLEVGRMRVPLGVVAMIYESRPSATVDAVALCLKSGNGLVLRGGSEALRTNVMLARTLSAAAVEAGVPEGAFALVPRAERADVSELLSLSGLIDLVVPRGGEGLIRLVEEQARMPVLRHGTGVCHVVVDADADLDHASDVIFNGKVRNASVCNATEAVVVHATAAAGLWQRLGPRLRAAGVKVRGDPETLRHLPWATPAEDADWGREYLDLVLAVRTVESFEAALEHVHRYGTQHTETLMTNTLAHARRFQREVDASAVIVNGSTRLNEGFIVGQGTQLGISTSKLHAYGPMGANELTTTKFVMTGAGHLRE